MEFLKISVVVVNYNLAEFLKDALDSVVSQNYPNLELIVVDGGSGDGSLDIIDNYSDKLAFLISEEDDGQYDALNKGFRQATGDIHCWLNSDDKFLSNSLFVVNEIFQNFPKVHWLTGRPMEFRKDGAIVNRISFNWGRWSKRRYLTYDFQFIQQESTFWRSSLWKKAGSKLSSELKLAGDMELWNRFFEHEKLFSCTFSLAGFRYRGGDQRSRVQMKEYLKECKDVIDSERKKLNLLSNISLGFLRMLGIPLGVLFFYQVPFLERLYPLIYHIPPLIQYDLTKDQFCFEDTLVFHPPLLFKGKQLSIRK